MLNLVRTDMPRERGGEHLPSLPCDAEAEKERRLALILRMLRNEQVTHNFLTRRSGGRPFRVVIPVLLLCLEILEGRIEGALGIAHDLQARLDGGERDEDDAGLTLRDVATTRHQSLHRLPCPPPFPSFLNRYYGWSVGIGRVLASMATNLHDVSRIVRY